MEGPLKVNTTEELPYVSIRKKIKQDEMHS